MPEYLSPGVYIEEVPARIKAIEGVSTSTAGFVGECERGPVPGFEPFGDLSLDPGFTIVPDDAPALVTGFPTYRRLFGVPPTDPDNRGYLGHSVRAFFDNGGKRAYISRLAREDAAVAWEKAQTGIMLRLRRDVDRDRPVQMDFGGGEESVSEVFLNSLAGITIGTVLEFVSLDGQRVLGSALVRRTDTAAGSALTTLLDLDLDRDNVFVRIRSAAAPTVTVAGTGVAPGITLSSGEGMTRSRTVAFFDATTMQELGRSPIADFTGANAVVLSDPIDTPAPAGAFAWAFERPAIEVVVDADAGATPTTVETGSTEGLQPTDYVEFVDPLTLEAIAGGRINALSAAPVGLTLTGGLTTAVPAGSLVRLIQAPDIVSAAASRTDTILNLQVDADTVHFAAGTAAVVLDPSTLAVLTEIEIQSAPAPAPSVALNLAEPLPVDIPVGSFVVPTRQPAITVATAATAPVNSVTLNHTEELSGTSFAFLDAASGAILTRASGTVDAANRQINIAPAGGVGIPEGALVRLWPGGPLFRARNPGEWGNSVEVYAEPADRPPVAVAQAIPSASPATTRVAVTNTASFYLGACVEIDHDGTGRRRTVARVSDLISGALILDVAVNDVTASGTIRTLEIDIRVTDLETRETELFRGLCWNGDADRRIRRRHYSTILNTRSRLVHVLPDWGEAGVAAEAPPDLTNRPVSTNATGMLLLSGDDGATAPDAARIVGDDEGPGNRTGMQALQDADDVRLIAAPGYTEDTVQLELITQCERMRYRFAVLDCERDVGTTSVVNRVLQHRNLYDTSFGAYYFPWVQIRQSDGDLLALPPSGYVMGICARVDTERGVHKAPANEVVRNVIGLTSYATTGEQDILNPRGVNVIRKFEGRGIRVWGGRTLSSDAEFRYVNVRRTMIFLSASIDRGTQWVVFEPNSPPTWARVVDSVSAFLHTQWRSGALFGRRPEDAFYVRCDESTMSEDDVLNGRLICEIGVAIVRPAEFVIFRIEQLSGFAQT